MLVPADHALLLDQPLAQRRQAHRAGADAPPSGTQRTKGQNHVERSAYRAPTVSAEPRKP